MVLNLVMKCSTSLNKQALEDDPTQTVEAAGANAVSKLAEE